MKLSNFSPLVIAEKAIRTDRLFELKDNVNSRGELPINKMQNAELRMHGHVKFFGQKKFVKVANSESRILSATRLFLLYIKLRCGV